MRVRLDRRAVDETGREGEREGREEGGREEGVEV